MLPVFNPRRRFHRILFSLDKVRVRHTKEALYLLRTLLRGAVLLLRRSKPAHTLHEYSSMTEIWA